jgi:hypothetical protein
MTARAGPCPTEIGTGDLLGLAGGGVCRAAPVARGAVSSYLAISPLPVPALRRAIGGVFSVALSRGLPRVGVTDHRALPSPDFPPG